MPDWTWEDVRRRNQEVFGAPEPVEPLVLPEKDPKDVSEAAIELECCKLLAEDNWRVLKTDPVSDRSRGKGFGERGQADTLCLRYGRQPAAEVLWIEWKRPGGRVHKHQIEWHGKERARGAMTVIAGVDFPPSVPGFIDWYRASGLARVGW